MEIVIIGSGNVAAVMGRKFIAAGHQIMQIVSRNASEASELAYEWNTESANYLTLIYPRADVYLIAVSDNAISAIAGDLKLPGKVVAHTAASVAKEVLKPITEHFGVFYPLQSLRKEMKELPEIPIYFEGNDSLTTSRLKKLAETVSYQQPISAGPDERIKLHVAAVMVNNFVNHLLALTEEYCRREQIDFTQLLPLLEETVSRIKEISPSQAQTGPAIRHDIETLHKHLEILDHHPQLKSIYLAMTESIQHI